MPSPLRLKGGPSIPLPPSSQIREEGEKNLALFRRQAVEKGHKNLVPLPLGGVRGGGGVRY
jgi:hypothetical protein